MDPRRFASALAPLALVAATGFSCAKRAVEPRTAPLLAVRTDSVPDTAGVAAAAGDLLDPQARCRWSAMADLNLDGRQDLAFFFQREGDSVLPEGAPCLKSDLVLVAQAKDGTFPPQDALVASRVLGGSGCADSTPAALPRIRLAPGSLEIEERWPGLDTVEQKLSFAWEEDQATWVLADARQRWHVAAFPPFGARWVVDGGASSDPVALEEFDATSYAREHFMVPCGGRVVARKQADLDLDGQPEILLAIETAGPPPGVSLRFADGSRILSVAKILPSGNLVKMGENPLALPGPRSGGALGDAFTGLEAGPGWFSLQDMSGAASKLSRRQVFRWSKVDKNWFLSEASTQVHLFHEDGADEAPVVRTSREFGKISWTDYDADAFIARFEN